MLAVRVQDLWATGRDALGLGHSALRGSYVPLLIASVGINILGLALPIFILQIYDRVLPNQAEMTLLALSLGLVAALAADVALRWLRANIATWNGARFEHHLRCEAVERLLRAPLGRFERETPGAYLERVNAIGVVRNFHASQLLLVLVDLPFSLLFLALIAYLGGWLVLVPIALLVVFGVLTAAVGRALSDSVVDRAEADRRRYDFQIETLRGIFTVKVLALANLLLRRHEALQEASAVSVRRTMYQSSLAQTVGGVFSQINLAALVAFGALLVLGGGMTVGALAACTLLSGRALQPLQTALGLWTRYQEIRTAHARLAEVTSLPSECEGRTAMPAIEGSIELIDIAYRRGPDEPLLLNGVNLKVEPGEIVGIEGDTGAGKSTLLLAMAGLLQAECGTVRVDGHDISEIDPTWLRRHVALLPQNGALFGGTILDNLTNFRDGECDNEALYLSYLLGLDEAIKRLPDGFDSRVGASEVLPAGLRQRIAIVRELVKQPRIILFDDADRALDADSSRKLLGLLKQFGGNTAIVVVSSKPQILNAAGRRFRLSRGRLMPISPATGKAQISKVAS